MTVKEQPDVCVWSYDDHEDAWETNCGEMFQLSNDYGPADNGFRFCPYCGRPLQEERPAAQGDDDAD